MGALIFRISQDESPSYGDITASLVLVARAPTQQSTFWQLVTGCRWRRRLARLGTEPQCEQRACSVALSKKKSTEYALIID
jgi:hypothetical protein